MLVGMNNMNCERFLAQIIIMITLRDCIEKLTFMWSKSICIFKKMLYISSCISLNLRGKH